MMKKLRRYRKPLAIVLAGLQLVPAFMPLSTYALTGGPSVPEVQQFSPAENTEMVNLFTGDFSYQIPLMDVGGYPLTLSYSSNVGMESEASMVGLGWNINTGSISRDVRGLPDDFNGEKISMTRSANPDETISVGAGLDAEITGYETYTGGEKHNETGGASGSIGLAAALELSHNNYNGWSAGFSGGLELKGSSKGNFKSNAGLGLGVTADSEKGAGINTSANIGFASKIDEDEGLKGGFGYGLDVSSRAGIKKHSFGADFGYKNSTALGKRDAYGGIKGLGMKAGEFGGGGKFSIGYSSPTMSPTIDWPMYTDGFSGDLKVGGEIGGVLSLSGDLKFAYENKRYAKNHDAVPAYGYMYAHNSTGGREVVDVLREKGNSVSKEIPNLPMAQFTHDMFQVNVQGIQSSFRAFRGDVGTLFDPFTNEVSCKGGVGVEVNVGDLVKVGANIRVPVEYGQSAKWTDGNQFNSAFSFKKQIADNPLYEAVYFKSMGEATAMANKQLFETIGGFAAVTPMVDEHGNTNEQLLDNNRNVIADNRAAYVRSNREFRQNNFQWLTIRDASVIGINRQISNYPINTFLQYGTSSSYESRIAKENRVRAGISQDQIAEVKVTRTDGTRFVFSVPAYNNTSSDVSFCIAGNTKDKKNGLVAYTPGVDNSTRNVRGDNHLYDKETTPAHAYAWMLTEMLSADYVDLTGNGPSADDLGSYTKFNYTKADDNYRWRIPVQRDSAVFKEGVKSDPDDDMASYSYGTKELWYVHSIETKNYIAEFTYSDRDDAVGVLGENGGLDTRKRMKKLDKIELYTKASRLEVGAVPIKTVHFVYDYSLCKKVPNNINGEGKLTLKRVWFQYGSSEKGSRNPYLFSYSETNPNYHPKKFDRWGNYIDADGEDGIKSYAALPRATADNFASAWLLTRITMPTGSVMNVQYETNDYAYVQNKVAMEMVPVVGFTNVTGKRNAHALEGDDPVAKLYESDNRVNNYLQFKLKKPVSSDEEVIPYIANLRELYFSMNVRMSHGDSVRREVYEKAEGFITLYLNEPGFDYGVCDDHNFGWIRLPQVNNGDRMIDQNSSRSDLDYADGVHPISKSAWETIRKKYMHLVYNEEPNPGDPTQLGTALENCFNTMGEIFTQVNLYLRNGKHANTAKLKGAKIRLNSPDLIKFGGGARVKKITISDEWGNMVQDPSLNFSYGKTYEYTTTSGNDTISSGVAQYEPASGNEENPFVTPYRYVSEKPLSVDFNLYQTGPVGQIYFPAPVIGYSRVKVKDIQPEGAPATGFAVNEFYTAKDFPTLVRTTQMHIRSREIQVPPYYSEQHLNATQGFSVELNDMHGKQKATYSYAPGNSNPISGTLYNYNTNPANAAQLSNEVQTVNATTGNIQTELVGVDYDFFADARENQQHSMLPEVGVNVDISVRGPAVVVIPSVYPGYTHFFGRLRAATFNKVIYRCGLLREAISFDNGAQISTHHLLRDRESGEVFLQDVENEFGDKQYNLTYPARWLAANSGMNGAYRNVGVQINQLNVTDGTATLTNADKYFHQGDEVVCISRDAAIPRSTDGTTYGSTDTFTTAWVMNVDDAQYVRLINREGSKLRSGYYDIRVARSGFRNIINAPAGKFNLTASPISENRLVVPESNVLSAEATEFTNHWQTYGLFESAPSVYSCSCSHNQITKRNAVDLLGELVNKLLTSGDYRRRGVNLNSTYSGGVAMFAGRFSGPIVYNGLLSGSMSRGNVVGYNSMNPEQQCELDIRMQDGTTFFPDSIISFTIDSRSFDDGDGDCNDIYTATGTITYLGAPVVSQSLTSGITRLRLTARVSITSCVPLANCQTVPSGRGEVRCLSSGRTTINPFVSGVLGNWRPLKSWVFATTLNLEEHLRNSGTYNNFSNFFTNTFPLRIASGITSSNWKEKSMLTVADVFGRAIESKDALGNYSAELYGYGFSLPTATATNAQHGEIAFDGFEDYNFRNQPSNPFNSCPLPAHFKPTEFEACDATVSHTGMYSLVVNTGTSVTRKYAQHYDFPIASTSLQTYNANSSTIISPFSPTPGKDFFLSVWVKKTAAEGTSSGAGGLLQQLGKDILPGGGVSLPGIGGSVGSIIPSITQSDVVVTARNSAGTSYNIGNFKAEGNPIDGWYQVNGKFLVPPDAVSINVELKALNGKTWFDDLRIQPFNSVMKTFVYHSQTLRLMATLDENNYATLYVYDQQEQLVATKKETENGIFTVQEARNGTSKISKP
ncbi:MAG: hypothetical protein U0T74_07125 [Chitinophagales bacterium]